MIRNTVLATTTQARLEQAAGGFVVALVIRHHAQIADQRQAPEEIAGPGVCLLGGLEELPRTLEIAALEQDVGDQMEAISHALEVTDLAEDLGALVEMQP